MVRERRKTGDETRIVEGRSRKLPASCSAERVAPERPLSSARRGPRARSGSGSSALRPRDPVQRAARNGEKRCQEPDLRSIIVLRYEGETRDGLFHGRGTAHFQGGHVYEGAFCEGNMHGHGAYRWADGIRYEGEFILNVPMGHGTYTWPDGSFYEGEVVGGIRHGVGTYRCGTKDVSYRGQWRRGKRQGKGIIYYNKEMTSLYEGDWLDNIREGWGVRCYPSGNVYEGQWRNNARHGEGTMKWLALGQQYTGQWEKGIQQGRGTHTWFLKRIPSSQYALRNEYTGGFVQGVRQGQGRFCYASGAVYSGGWQNNKKHGRGTFIFKNGRVFEGEFVDDRMAEFPAFWGDDAQTPELSGIRIQTPPSTDGESPRKITGRASGCSLVGPDMALDIPSLLAGFPEEQRDPELRQLEFAVLRHIAELRTVYNFYSSLGNEESPDNTFLLTRFQLWRLLKDCQVQRHGITLVQVDRILQEEGSPDEIHSPFGTLLFRRFLSGLVILAHHMYHRGLQSCNNVLVGCFSKMMRNNILPNATNVKGVFFSHPARTAVAANYVKQCWEIYKALCRLHSDAPHDLTMTMRHFVWMLKDLDLFDSELTIGKVVKILCCESPAMEEVSICSLDLEINFLEFFEALLCCAEVKSASSAVIPPVGDVAGEELRESSFPVREGLSVLSAKMRETLHLSKSKVTDWRDSVVRFPTDKEDPKLEELDHWARRTQLFFCKIFFPAYEYSLLLRKEVQEERLRNEERLREEAQEERLRKEAQTRASHAKAKETARLRKQREADEEHRRKVEQGADEAAKVDVLKEVSTQSPALPSPVASTASVGSLKHFPVNGRRKKK